MQFIIIIWSPRLVPNEEQRLMSISQEGGKDIFFLLLINFCHLSILTFASAKNNTFVPKRSTFHVILEPRPERVNSLTQLLLDRVTCFSRKFSSFCVQFMVVSQPSGRVMTH